MASPGYGILGYNKDRSDTRFSKPLELQERKHGRETSWRLLQQPQGETGAVWATVVLHRSIRSGQILNLF